MTQLCWVQILQAENESAAQGLSPSLIPSLPLPSLDTIKEHLAAGNMCACVCNSRECVRVVKLIQIHVNTRDRILECVPLVLGTPD